jgi:hypothetical protein
VFRVRPSPLPGPPSRQPATPTPDAASRPPWERDLRE